MKARRARKPKSSYYEGKGTTTRGTGKDRSIMKVKGLSRDPRTKGNQEEPRRTKTQEKTEKKREIQDIHSIKGVLGAIPNHTQL